MKPLNQFSIPSIPGLYIVMCICAYIHIDAIPVVAACTYCISELYTAYAGMDV